MSGPKLITGIEMVMAQHNTRVDRNGKPIVKSFPIAAWENLHSDEWTPVYDIKKAPAPLKAKVTAVNKPAKSTAKALVKKAVKNIKSKKK